MQTTLFNDLPTQYDTSVKSDLPLFQLAEVKARAAANTEVAPLMRSHPEVMPGDRDYTGAFGLGIAVTGAR